MDQGKHLVMESGTGTGKTVCSLVGAFQHAKARRKKVLYLTRTISQSDQIMKELRSISRRQKVTGLPLLGRRKSCLLMRTLAEFEDIPPHALAKLCEERKSRTLAKEKGGCPHFADFLAIGEVSFLQYCATELPTAEEFDRYCEKQGACPYEARKALLPLVDVVVVPYVQLLSKEIRSQLFDRMKLTMDDFVLVVDEAHNLIDAARDQESFDITIHDVEAAESGGQGHGQPPPDHRSGPRPAVLDPARHHRRSGAGAGASWLVRSEAGPAVPGGPVERASWNWTTRSFAPCAPTWSTWGSSTWRR